MINIKKCLFSRKFLASLVDNVKWVLHDIEAHFQLLWQVSILFFKMVETANIGTNN